LLSSTPRTALFTSLALVLLEGLLVSATWQTSHFVASSLLLNVHCK
jgi:hypothetical protein